MSGMSTLSDIPSDQWTPLSSILNPTYEANVSVLKTTLPDVVCSIHDHSLLTAIEVRRTPSGRLEAQDSGTACRIEIEPPALELEQQRLDRLVRGFLPKEIASVVWQLGIDCGQTTPCLLQHLSIATQKIAVLVEPDLRYLVLAMLRFDLTSMFQSNRFLWALGDDWLSCIERMYHEKNLFVSPRDEVLPSVSSIESSRKMHWQTLSAALRQWKQSSQRAFDGMLQDAVSYYANHCPDRVSTLLAVSLKADSGKAIPYIQSRFLRECEEQGVRVLYHRASFRGDISLLKMIATERPDCLFLVNKVAGEYGNPDTLNSLRFPRMIWLIDDPGCFVGETFHQNDIVFTWDQAYEDVLQHQGAQSVDFFPYVADLDDAQPRYREEFASPVSYIGQVKAPRAEELGLGDEELDFTRRMGKLKAASPHRSYEDLVREHQGEAGLNLLRSPTDEIPRFLRYAMYIVANACRRISVLEKAMPFGLKLYGNEDWLEVLGDHPLKHCYQGPADPENDVADIFLSSTINLNIHSLQALTSLNQRDFNCPLVGGFLITDWVDGAERFFEPETEMVFYHSLDELVAKIGFYLGSDGKRNAIMEAGRTRVMREHTYASRVPAVLKTLADRIRERYG